VEFDKGLYLNPGPWRIPYHHYAALHYCKLFKVALEPFVQVNYAAYVHSTKAFGGKPQRYRYVQADFNGYVAELLGKATSQGKLDEAVSREDREVLLEAMRGWGALDESYSYKRGLLASNFRGYDSDPGGGLTSVPSPSTPLAFSELMQSRLWGAINAGHAYEFQNTLFQPVGGMGMFGKAFGRELEGVIQYNAKVTEIKQTDKGVTVGYQDSGVSAPFPRLSCRRFRSTSARQCKTRSMRSVMIQHSRSGCSSSVAFGNRTIRSMEGSVLPINPTPS
jgi:monoamine oxidase